MGTDDLSTPTYKGIIIEAEKFNHDLTLQFGVLASGCKDDDDYLNQAEALIKEWIQIVEFEDIIDEIFYGESVNEKEFKKTLEKMLTNIVKIRKTVMDKRGYKD